MANQRNARILFDIPKIELEPHLVTNILSERNFQTLKTEVLKVLATAPYDPLVARWNAGMLVPDEVQKELLQKVRAICKNDDIQYAYNHLVKYQIKDGCIPSLWEHVDQNGSHVSVNITIETTIDWKLIVERQTFDLSENSAVIFKGQEHDHARPPYPSSNPDDYVIQWFAEYATSDHWIITQNELPVKDGIGRFGRDGDVRFFNRHRYFPIPDPPSLATTCNHEHVRNQYANVLGFYEWLNDTSEQTNEIEKTNYELVEKEQLFPGLKVYEIGNAAADVLWGLTVNSCYKQWSRAAYGAQDKMVSESMRYETFFLYEKHKTCHPVDPITRLASDVFSIFDEAVSMYSSGYPALRKLTPEEINSSTPHRATIMRSAVGNEFTIHADEQPDKPRIVTAIMYLNDSYTDRNNSYTGGELVFDQIGIEIQPKAGQIVIFPSNYLFSHIVKPVASGVRYAVSRFYCYSGNS